MARGTRATVVVAAMLLALGAIGVPAAAAAPAPGPASACTSTRQAHPAGSTAIVENVAGAPNKAPAPLSEVAPRSAATNPGVPALGAVRVEGDCTPSRAARPSVGSRAPPLPLRLA
jgi:hypothetical protein